MSKYLNVSTGDYRIKVQPGGIIDLDTGHDGANPGKVVIRGDLEVQGETTYVDTTDLAIEDNIIVLNRGETSPDGISDFSGTSGIKIDRGPNQPGVQWVYDENLRALNPIGGFLIPGGVWSPRDDLNTTLGVELTSITTPNGGDLNLLGVYGESGNTEPATGVVAVYGTVNYEDRIVDDDHIPNKKYVDDAIQQQLQTKFQDTIQEGTFTGTETRVEVRDDTVTGDDSVAIIAVNGIERAEFYDDYSQIYNVRISGISSNPAVIESKSSLGNQDLVIRAEGTGRVTVQDDVVLTRTRLFQGSFIPAPEPSQPSDGTSIYSEAEGVGGTGLYFVNEEGTRDELISKKRALFFSSMF